MKNILILFIFLLSINSLQAQKITGDWYGSLNVQGTELPLVFHLQKNDSSYSATMDSPTQGGYNIKVDQTQYDNSIVEMEIEAAMVKYKGNYDKKTQKINGTFTQRGMSFPLNLNREKKTTEVNRPQEPKKPFPYNSQDISFYNDVDKIKLAGTLTTPKNKKNFPTVILITGSGPQNRNEEAMNHKPFLVISDYLTRNGIAVLRYDDRGVGESEGDYSTANSKDLSRDTEAAIKFLKSRKEINKNKIGLIGHSEGGLIAPMIATNSEDVSFLVLLAGPGLKGEELLLLQKKLTEQKSGINELAVNKSQEIFKGAYDIISDFRGNDDELRNMLKKYFNQKFNNAIGKSQLNSLIQQMTSPWMKYFIKYDPSSVLEKIDVPVLALFGKNDLQVPAIENSKVFEEIDNKNIQILLLDNLNHLFQESKTGLPNEYSHIEETISPKVLNIVSKWITEHN